jgi:hypothetical protein
MPHLNLLRFPNDEWRTRSIQATERAARYRRRLARRLTWEHRLLRWHQEYARLAFVFVIWGVLLTALTLILTPEYRPAGTALLIVANVGIWADTTKRLLTEDHRGFFE